MKVFIVFESRYEGLASLLANGAYTQKVMGEITWFMSLMKHLQNRRDTEVVHCSSVNSFRLNLRRYKSFHPSLIMDYMTIPATIEFINLNKTYCLSYWAQDENSVKQLGNKNGEHLALKNVLTPFDYNNQNSYLGYNLDILCERGDNRKFEKNVGILWGKDIEYVDLELVTRLCEMGISFYSTSRTELDIKGVSNLGILPKKKWHLLLNNCNFILGSGHPASGPTILEALYYKTNLFCPSSQVPASCHGSKNIHFIDNMSPDQVFNGIVSAEFEDDLVTKSLIDSNGYDSRVTKIFNL
jgi:hypothetical protein